MKNRELNFHGNKLKYTDIIGTGGIGSGKFFMINGNETLGREESRSGHFMDVNDYCKQHIILHYIKVLLGTSVNVFPVGKIGDDDVGHKLFDEMSETGFDMSFIEKVPNVSTLFSFCFYYPDGSGGNLTTDNSASSLVDSKLIGKARKYVEKIGPKGLIMAAPEVPLSARKELLELGKKNNLFCTASFTSEEMKFVLNSRLLNKVDLLAINLHEAYSVLEPVIEPDEGNPSVERIINEIKKDNKKIMISVTAGRNGSWSWDGHTLNFYPAIETEAVSTAGAGDAFFSGLLCGIALDLHLFEAQQLATLLASLSVTAPHTIHNGIDRSSLKRFADISGHSFSNNIINLLED